jgi:hypothetical protein
MLVIMNKELEKQIIECAPHLFQYKGSDDIRKSLLSFGFDCGDGWFDILKHLVCEISKVDINKECKVVQIKEKFGTLRFYIDNATDEIYDLIINAEKETMVTCEDCGKIGTLKQNRWWRVTCDECEKKREETRKTYEG